MSNASPVGRSIDDLDRQLRELEAAGERDSERFAELSRLRENTLNAADDND